MSMTIEFEMCGLPCAGFEKACGVRLLNILKVSIVKPSFRQHLWFQEVFYCGGALWRCLYAQ